MFPQIYRCMSKKVLRFKEFKNIVKESPVLESGAKSTAIMVGDSTVSSINDSIKGLSSKPQLGSVKRGNVKPGLYSPGIGSKGFLKMIDAYSKVHPEVGFVFLAMGTNDAYTISQENKKIAQDIANRLKEIFPNAAKMYIIKGTGWGWGESTKKYYPSWMWKGGNIDNGPVDSSPKEIDEYYNSVWAPTGIKLIPVTIGIQKDKNGYAKHIGPRTPGVSELSNYIQSVIGGKVDVYREDIKGDQKANPVMTGNAEETKDFYDSLENAFNEEEILKEEPSRTRKFNSIVQRAQIGLQFLGFDVSQYGPDGLFGTETAKAVSEFKKKYRVSGNPEEMDDNFFAALINSLRRRRFKKADIQKASDEEKIGSTQNFDLSSVSGDNEYLMYMAHNQGPAGASWLVKSMLGLGDKLPPWKNIKGNIPGKYYPGIGEQIRAAHSSGDSKKAATLFLNMWKDRYNKIKKEALNYLNQPKNAEVKRVLESNAGQVPLDILATFAYIESALNPKAGNATYKGLFALNPSTASSHYRGINSQNVFDPEVNTKAAIEVIKANTKSFLSNVGDQAVSQLGLSKIKTQMA